MTANVGGISTEGLSNVPDAPLLLLRNADVHAPTHLGRQDLLIGGGRILAMQPAEDAARPTPAHTNLIDLQGRRVMPGLIDGHAHITGGGGEAGAHTRVPPVPLSRFTRAGITTVVGLLGTDDTTRSTRELVATANGLRNEGLNAYAYTGGYHLPLATVTGSVRDDLAFIDCLIGVGELAICDHRSSQPTRDELLRVAADAHVGGLLTGKAGILHLHLGDGPRGLAQVREALDASEIPARVFNPTHVNRRRASSTASSKSARRGCTIDITAFPVAADEDAWAADEALLRYLDSGAPAERVTVSSDGGGCLPVFDTQGRMLSMGVGAPDSLHKTLKMLLARGETLERVLPAFTSNPARLLRLENKGRVAQGADADLLILNEDDDVSDVLISGRWFVRDGQAVIRGTFEGAR
ncbi:beta-aspartyl-peptidase [Lysobacter sp. A03]|uniref:beta-aspartyl-peptidase n=1 Tax=Lysobacter sp. A03 TaxID=1199154 RepID=UPI0005B73F55|nr:beta-aspartyl-peptidase [Lysobacter sp. A03]KIQ96802.1 Isoaspartyl dipeptidase [Lysobacter sp. A03]